jgi:intergrase/recombinase
VEKLELKKCGCNASCLKAKALEVRSKSKWYKNAFRNWINLCFELGELTYDDLHRMRKLAAGGKKENKIPGAQHVDVQLKDLEELSTSVRAYFLLLYYTGIRGSEAIEVKKRLSEAKCNSEFCLLELNWSRGHKRVYVVIFPSWLKKELEEAPAVSVQYLRKVGMRIGGLKSLRKNWYQKCTEVCPESVCDFMQGRVNTVSAKHYMDLFQKAKNCYPRVYKRLEGEIDFRTFVIERLRKALEAYLRELAYGDFQQPPP